MFGSLSNAERGTCPAKIMMYYGPAATELPFVADHALVACNLECPGAQPEEHRFLRIFSYDIEVCPIETPVNISLQTPDN